MQQCFPLCLLHLRGLAPPVRNPNHDGTLRGDPAVCTPPPVPKDEHTPMPEWHPLVLAGSKSKPKKHNCSNGPTTVATTRDGGHCRGLGCTKPHPQGPACQRNPTAGHEGAGMAAGPHNCVLLPGTIQRKNVLESNVQTVRCSVGNPALAPARVGTLAGSILLDTHVTSPTTDRKAHTGQAGNTNGARPASGLGRPLAGTGSRSRAVGEAAATMAGPAGRW